MKVLLTIMMLLSTTAFAEIKVAVIDTGLPFNSTFNVCGSKDFTNTSIMDINGHGSNISHIIDRYAKGENYCQLILKYYPSNNNLLNVLKSLRYAIDQKVDIINYSGGGTSPDSRERVLIKEALDKNIVVVVAAGNEGNKKTCKFYPACYDDRIIVVGAKDKNGKILKTSNVNSKVDMYLPGHNIRAGGRILSGTSQAAAAATGLMIKILNKKRSK